MHGKTAQGGETAVRQAGTASTQRLRRSLAVLEVLGAAEKLAPAAIARRVGLSRPSTIAILDALVERGYARHAGDGLYAVGMGILPMAASLLDNNRVRLVALPELSGLARVLGERVNLGVAFAGRLLYMAGVEKPTLPNLYSRFGRLAPLHCSSLGKALLAFSGPDLLERVVGAPLSRHTANTIVDPDQLRQEIGRVRERGYAIDDAEHVPATYCVGVPVFAGRPEAVAAIGFTSRSLDKIMTSIEPVRLSAEVISHILASGSRP